MKKQIKIGLLLLILGMLFIPILQICFSFSNEKPLQGSFELSPKPNTITISDWLNGKYQEEYTHYFDVHIGFRPTLVRIFNQIQYSFFKKTNAKDVQIGKDNYLFEGGYIRDYMGYSFIGENKITEKVKRIQNIQNELKKDSINLIIVFAPGKASYFPEFFPSQYDTTTKTLSNYLCYVKKCEELDVDFIDINSSFIQYKKKSKHPLFPKGGIHWGELGVSLAFDSITKYIEQKRSINIPDFDFSKIEYPDNLLNSDRDISDAMNLFFEYKYYKMPKPYYIFKDTIDTEKPKLLIIGDSYGYGLTNSVLMNKLFSNTEFWYYNREIKPNRKNHSSKVEDINVKKELKKFDVVLLLSTETNLFKFDFEFTDSYNNIIKK